MKAVIGDDALDAALANLEVGLAKLLRDDLGGGLRVQEEVAQDLAHDLVGAAVIGLGASLVGLEGEQAALPEVVQELIIALAAEAVFLGEVEDVALEALAFDEHEEAAGQLVGGGDGQGADRAGQLVGVGVELEGCIHGWSLARKGGCV